MERKFKELYYSKNLDYNCNKLFGPMFIHDSFFISKNKLGMFCIEGDATLEKAGPNYCEVDSISLLDDIVNYGQQLYKIFKSKISVLKPTSTGFSFQTSKIVFVNEDDINKKIDKVFAICKSFCCEYDLPFISNRYFPPNYSNRNQVPLSFIVNQMLLIFTFHVICKNLSNGYNQYSKLYKSIHILEKDNDLDIIKKMIRAINIYSRSTFNLAFFALEICMEDDKPIPITVTSNLFTFAFEVIQNNIAALSFYSKDKQDNSLYVGFKKCARCLKNISDEMQTAQNSIPRLKHVYCDSCKKEMRRISSARYEHKLSSMYNELKEHKGSCSTNLSNIISNLKPREKITLRELEPVYNLYLKEKKDD